MLNKRTSALKSPATSVKTVSRAVAAILATATLAMANTSYADSGLLVEKVVTVKIKMSDFDAPNGTAAVYEKLKAKAARTCLADKSTLYYLSQSVSECTEDLLGQFIETSEISSLVQYHNSQKI